MGPDNTIPFELLRASIRSFLEMPYAFQWSVQGFGMLRTYLDEQKRYRLNIWDSSLAVPGVSTIHDHPWDFTSWIICGEFVNQRFEEGSRTQMPYFLWDRIKTGEGGGPTHHGGAIGLRKLEPERYTAGDRYEQLHWEVHESLYADGTVTINDRVRRGDGEHARVFWPEGEWVDAEPRQATPREIVDVTRRALAVLRSELS